MELKEMTDNELEERQREINESRAKLKAEAKEVAVEMDRRAASRQVDTMSDAEKENLRQALGPASIETGEAVGEPGG